MAKLSTQERERWVYKYITALDNDDMDTIDAVLDVAHGDSELTRIIKEVNAEMASELGIELSENTAETKEEVKASIEFCLGLELIPFITRIFTGTEVYWTTDTNGREYYQGD